MISATERNRHPQRVFSPFTGDQGISIEELDVQILIDKTVGVLGYFYQGKHLYVNPLSLK